MTCARRCLAAAMLLCLGVALFWAPPLRAADWPMWRFDAGRSAASPQQFPTTLHLQWSRKYPALKPAWPDQPKMQFDAAYEPIVYGKTLYVGSPHDDALTALDTETGEEKWRFFAEGPIRFAPVAWEGRLYFTADDGYLYCLDAATGSLVWKFRGGPSDRKILGNERLISTWPARGAPVVADGTVYFAASIWPFMGIFIHALDARTGEVRWTNDGDGSIYMKQPHNTDAFAAVAPQGPMVVVGDRLLIPGGRSVPACYDRRTGKLLRYQLAENGKRGGGHEVIAGGKYLFNGGAAFHLDTEKYLGDVGQPIVLAGDVLYAVKKDYVKALDLRTAEVTNEDTIDRRGKKSRVTRWRVEELSAVKVPPVECLIKAGTRLYAGSENTIVVIDAAHALSIIGQLPVHGTVARLIAGADRLFAVTYEGDLYCFGAERVTVRTHNAPAVAASRDDWTERVSAVLDASKVRDGYAVVWGAADHRLAAELARQSRLHVVVVEPDAKNVKRFRERLSAEALYGARVEVHHGSADTFALPAYLASLMVVDDSRGVSATVMPKVYAALRPYGGRLVFLNPSRKDGAEALPNARWAVVKGLVMLSREGAPPGAANWTHEHADGANTRVSKDQLVKAPLGLLWFGGPSNEGILPRHGHGPQPQVVDGRLIIEGVDLMRAMDIYTGRILWETRLPGVGMFYNNLAHQPGANSSGTNYISLTDGIYVVQGNACIRLDPETGKPTAKYALPVLPGANDPPRWGYINVDGDFLVGGADPLFDPALIAKLPKAAGDDPEPGEKRKDDVLTKLLAALKANNDNLSSSRHLVVMNRHTGRVLWQVSAEHGFRHNATCSGGGRLYTIDRLSGPQLARLKRRGEVPRSASRLRVFDLQTGKELWSTTGEPITASDGKEEEGVFGTWLSYSAKHDVLVEAGRVARDSLPDEPKGMRAYRADTGKVLWFNKSYTGPAMIHGDTILQGQGACDLLTGAEKMRQDPLTGESVPWSWARNYGCNTPMASEHLLTFRSGAAGYFDYCNDGGTGNFGGFRSSCTNNLLVAGGVLCAPDYTRTCTCLYQNQTSLALVHMPDAEMWTFFGTKTVKGPIQRIGINLGAPGDRRADDGTLWLEYPSVAGVSPAVTVKTSPENPEWFRRHASQVAGTPSWIGASGAKGLKSFELTLSDVPEQPMRKFTVRLYFMEPDKMKPGERVFDVALQGQAVIKELDIAKEAGGHNRTLVREVNGVEVNGRLFLELTPVRGAPILCGVEAVAEAAR